MSIFDKIKLGRPSGFVGYDKASLGPAGRIRKAPTVVRKDAVKVLKGAKTAAKKVAPVVRVARRVERGARKFFSFL